MIEDEVLFTPHLATIVVDLQRTLSHIIRETCGLSLLAFCLLASVRSHDGTMALAAFSRKAIARENTVVVAAAELAEAGFVRKERSEEDGRVVVLTETAEGSAALEEGFSRVYERLRATVWSGHDDADIKEIMTAFPSLSDKLGIDRVEINHRCHPSMTPAYLMVVSALLNTWEQEVARLSGLSFTDYRCLVLLESRPSPLPCSTIASMLMLEKSSVSALVARLRKGGLVTVAPSAEGDRRVKTVGLTEKGEVVAPLLTAKLGKATAELYAGVDPSLKARTNELHMRMYGTYAIR